jgi:hypothetical protein
MNREDAKDAKEEKEGMQCFLRALCVFSVRFTNISATTNPFSP